MVSNAKLHFLNFFDRFYSHLEAGIPIFTHRQNVKFTVMLFKIMCLLANPLLKSKVSSAATTEVSSGDAETEGAKDFACGVEREEALRTLTTKEGNNSWNSTNLLKKKTLKNRNIALGTVEAIDIYDVKSACKDVRLAADAGSSSNNNRMTEIEYLEWFGNSRNLYSQYCKWNAF